MAKVLSSKEMCSDLKAVQEYFLSEFDGSVPTCIDQAYEHYLRMAALGIDDEIRIIDEINKKER